MEVKEIRGNDILRERIIIIFIHIYIYIYIDLLELEEINNR